MPRPHTLYQSSFKHISTVARAAISPKGGFSIVPIDLDNSPHVAVPPLNFLVPDISLLNYPEAAPLVADMRAMYTTKYQKMANFLATETKDLSTRLEHLRTFFERQYHDQILSIERVAIKGAQKPLDVASAPKLRPIFNQEYVPYLEKYFKYNAYPSQPDRVALAKKSMMTSRQIEVWFQNHRNRARKEGKALPRLTSDSLPLKLSLESLEQIMPSFAIPELNRMAPSNSNLPAPDPSKDLKEKYQLPRPKIFSDSSYLREEAPPHAFPATYPPSCSYNPFPTEAEKYTFPTPVWMRKPCTVCPPRTAVDFNEFIGDFIMKLSLADDLARKPNYRSPSPDSTTRRPWTAAIYTTPQPAPLPALIRQPIERVPAHPPATRIQTSNPSPCPVSASPPNNNYARRIFAQLPERIPKYPSMVHRDVHPETPEYPPSPPRSLSPSSHTLATSADSAYFCKPLPSSSNSSIATSTLTTPIHSPTSLPSGTLLPVSISGVDFNNMEDLFADHDLTLANLNSNFSPYAGFSIPTMYTKDTLQFRPET